jgi:RNA polymerase sigma factor (sigma-70 family)
MEDAEDITQEVFIEVFHSLHLFKEQSALSTWIYRIAVNKSLDFLKAKKRKKRFAFLTQLFHPETGEVLHEVSHFDHPGVALENKERSQILFGAIKNLPENQKTAFVLFKIEGFPQKEIARIMNLSEKAVESLIQRAKENLKRSLGNIYHQRGI